MNMAPLLGALALILVLGAIMMWRQANSGAQRAATSAFLERQLVRGDAEERSSGFVQATQRRRSGFSWWDSLLLRAGLRQTAGFYVRRIVPIVVLTLLAGLLLGPVSAIAMCVLTTVFLYFLIWLRADRRQQRMLAQLPAFLDNMVRLITIGNSIGSAFQTAAGGADEPLREVVQAAASLSRTAKELDEALVQVSRQYRLKELYLVAAVVSVALRFGGRSDQVLERMAAFMRDLSQARNELSASSAEVRMSAWVLALLPTAIGGFIMIANNNLFMTLRADPVGFKMLLTSVGLQILGSYWLYLMAKSI